MVKIQTKVKELSNNIREFNTDGLKIKMDQLKPTDKPTLRKKLKLLKFQHTKTLWV